MTGKATCQSCGKAMDTNSAHVYVCGRCRMQRINQARSEQHVYARTHVHVHPDGSRTMELGTTCDTAVH